MQRGDLDNSISRRDFLEILAGSAALRAGLATESRASNSTISTSKEEISLIPGFHVSSCGWKHDFSEDRVHVVNIYLNHLDRLRDDPTYNFVFSEVSNIIAIKDLVPDRFEELKQRIKEGRVELVNAFFVEATPNLSGGEVLVKQMVEGLRWQQQVMGVRPRVAWMIDICGLHSQMGQICAGVGLDGMVYTRMNKVGSTLHWAESPDGSRALALCATNTNIYFEFMPMFRTKDLLSQEQLEDLQQYVEDKREITPAPAPLFAVAGNGDYGLAPLRKDYPREFLKQWKKVNPSSEIGVTTLAPYLNSILPGIKSGEIQLPTMRGGTGYIFSSFWVQMPIVKQWFRRNEHGLQTAESLATAASLKAQSDYPVQHLYHAWILTLLNSERDVLWGDIRDNVCESPTSWDVRDRLEMVEAISTRVQKQAVGALLPAGAGAGLFNPVNWERNEPLLLALPEGTGVAEAQCQELPDEQGTLCSISLPSVGIRGLSLARGSVKPSKSIDLPETIETRYYQARVDRKTGALTSLKTKPSGREILGGPGNVLWAERNKPEVAWDAPALQIMQRPEQRIRLASSNEFVPKFTVSTGPLVTRVEVESAFFGGSSCRRVMRFYDSYPRIDFSTELEDIPNPTIVLAEFPMANDIEEVRRGIPYGFSHAAWAKPNANLYGWERGIVPAVRWSHYALAGGGGLAILDRGVPGRELNGKIPLLYLIATTDRFYTFPTPWLSGKGPHQFSYALVAHEGDWEQARIPQMAWEFNNPAVMVPGRAASPADSFLQTSDNVIVEALRLEGPDIELRLVECFGVAGTAEVEMALPHERGALTDMLGGHSKLLEGGPKYSFPIRPQQIVTIRFRTASSVEAIKPLLKWDELVPKFKVAALYKYDPNVK